MKKLISLVVVLMLIVTPCISFADYVTIYENSLPKEELADGVTKETIERYTSQGWININVIRVDLTKNVDLTILTDKFLSSRDTLTNLVNKSNQNHDVVAAINSDFFDTANNTTMGNLVKDGEILTTSIGLSDFASFNVTKTDMPYVGYINTPTNSFTNGTYNKSITYINKPYLSYNRTIVYTSDWAARSVGKTKDKDIFEMLISDGVITETRRNGDPFLLTEQNYVISAVGKDAAECASAFHVGDLIAINYDVNFRFMDLSIGGGAQILMNGKIPEKFSQNITGNHPRSAIGISKNRKEIIMVTIDGRTNSYRGVNQTELANIMIKLGAFEAINLDGGGSSQMVMQSPWETSAQTVNRPSDGSERKMYTGFAITKKMVDQPVLLQTKIDIGTSDLVKGAFKPLVLKAIDSNYVALPVSKDQVIWELIGLKGTIKDYVLYPEETGKGTLRATYQNVVVEQKITILDNAVKLNVTPSVIKMDFNETKNMAFSVTTTDGKTISISADSIKATVPEQIGKFDAIQSTFLAGNKMQQAVVKFDFNGLTTYVPVAVGTKVVNMADFETATGFFSSYPETVEGNYREVATPLNGKQAGLLTYNFIHSAVTRATYMTFNKALEIPVDTQALGLWAFGDEGNDHWLRGKIIDAKGTATNITFARHVDWKGWKYVKAEIPAGLSYPLKLERIYMVESDGTLQDKGSIMIDDLTAIIGQNITINVPANITKVMPIDAYQIPKELLDASQLIQYSDLKEEALKAITKNTEVIKKDKSKTMTITESSKLWTIKLNNTDGSIRANGYQQWQELIAFAKKDIKKPVMVVMNDFNKFNDTMEGELLMTQLTTLHEKGIEVALVYPSTTSSYDIKFKNGITILYVPKIVDKAQGLKFGTDGKKICFETVK